VFTARYGLISYMKQITFRSLKVKRLCDGTIHSDLEQTFTTITLLTSDFLLI
jgi:hypothetical protein